MEVSRAQRVALIVQEMDIAPPDEDGFRIVTHQGAEMGLAVQTAEGSWALQWKPDGKGAWRETKSRLVADSPEQVEGWALEEIATYVAMAEEVRERDAG